MSRGIFFRLCFSVEETKYFWCYWADSGKTFFALLTLIYQQARICIFKNAVPWMVSVTLEKIQLRKCRVNKRSILDKWLTMTNRNYSFFQYIDAFFGISPYLYQAVGMDQVCYRFCLQYLGKFLNSLLVCY